jgi:putative ABC transport system permease protein
MSPYRLLLLAFPRRIRREYGDDMVRLFEAQLQEARAAGESVARLWMIASVDAVRHGMGERFAFLLRRILRTRSDASGRQPDRTARWKMHALTHDLKYGVRMLVRQPGVSIIAVVTLALGIGANTAMFSAVDAVLLRPLPYEDPDQLVMAWETRQAEGVLDNMVAPADFVDWARLNTVFDSMAAFAPSSLDLTGVGDPVRLPAGLVSPTFFSVFRIRPVLGRTFTADEGIEGRHRVVLLTHGLWERRFGADSAIVGRRLLFNGVPHEVIGVLPASFEFPDPTIEVWAPLAFEGTSEPLSRDTHNFFVYARMKPGVTVQQARGEMDLIGARLSQQYPGSNERHGVWVTSLSDQITGPKHRSAAQGRDLRTGLLLLLGSVAFVLLIACVNVANLLLVRAAGRRREMAVRAALGAGRQRLIGQTLTESLILGVAGGVLGLIVAFWGIGALRQMAPGNAQVVGLEHVGLDMRVLAFTFGLSLATGLLFGLLPAWHLANQDVNAALKDGARTAGVTRRRLRLALVVSEIALASLLLVGAGLTLRSFQTLLDADPGFTADGVLTSFVVLPESRYRDDERLIAASQQIERRLATIPGVRAAGVTSHLPLTGQDSRRGIIVEGREPTDGPTRAHPRVVTPGYFRAMGIQLASGRFFNEADRAGAPLVTIVNETMALRYWPGRSPIGRRVTFTGTKDVREIVGVIGDVRHWGIDQPVNPEMYLPLAQVPSQAVTFVIATDANPSALAGAVREQLRSFDQNLPLSNVRPMADVASRSLASQRAAMLLLGIFGVLALVLAAAGIYGVMAHLVALRSSEIGVRMTLGAKPSTLMRLILREGLAHAAIGLTIGLAASVFVMRAFRSMLHDVSPTDPITLAAVALILTATALAACAIPARRAMRVDPVQALRQ